MIIIELGFNYRGCDEMVDMLDLGSSASRRVGSSPSIRTFTDKRSAASGGPLVVYKMHCNA